MHAQALTKGSSSEQSETQQNLHLTSSPSSAVFALTSSSVLSATTFSNSSNLSIGTFVVIADTLVELFLYTTPVAIVQRHMMIMV